MTKKNYSLNFFVSVAIFIFLFGKQITAFIVDYMWFDALGYKQLFIIPLKAKLFLFIVFTILALLIFFVNNVIAFHFKKDKTPLKKRYVLVWVLSSFFVGFIASFNWDIYLKYMNGHSFNITDPIFSNDVSFYVFVMPFLSFIITMFMLILIINTVWISLIYLWKEVSGFFDTSSFSGTIPGDIPNSRNSNNFENVIDLKPIKTNLTKEFNISISGKNHLFILASLFFILTAARHYLARYDILFSKAGVVFGAGYADVNVALPIANVLVFVSVLIAFAFLVRIFFKSRKIKRRHILISLVLIYVTMIFSSQMIPAFVQNFKVNPNEFSLEEQYIKHNIKYTNIAYGLDNVQETFFDVLDNPTIDVLNRNKDEITKLRILDWRPLTQTYKQLQEIRLYYDFADIDIGKYNIDGEETQVMLSARDLDHRQLRDKAKTWINDHMVFTHGYGIVMSPVNKVTDDGLPEFLIKDIPPVSSYFNIERPEIYYGEIDNDFVIVNTDIDEFDYPKGDLNEYTNYAGKGGIVIDSFLKRILLAFYFSDINIMLNTDITKESRILFTRQIQDRISKVVPFLALDNDPYVVIVNGRIKWIQDAYTFTNYFPYSDPVDDSGFGVNYIRNPVKIVMDAYDGTLDFYLSDINDPIIKTYSKMFEGFVKDINMASDELKTHFRYPEDLFKVQIDMFATYHMKDPKVYYNREDLWDIPNEIYGQGTSQEMTPYYVLLRLPGMKEEEYVLISPYTPIKKDNMIAWISGRISFDENSVSNDLVLFKFPKDKLVYGPSQIEARIDQNSEISEQLTLWSQRGSNVIRGNLLVIPIENTLLYIEPLYITADNSEIPELKRIILSYGNKVVMEETLELGLNELFGLKVITKNKMDSSDSTLGETKISVSLALEYYNNIQKSMANGNWEGIGENMKLLENVLKDLSDE